MKFPQQYCIRKKILVLFGGKFHIYDTADNIIGFSKQKAFKLKEDIRVYTDETMTHERLFIKARNIIDFGASYDVTDSETGKVCGMWRRKGFKSLLRDSWELCQYEQVVGHLEEDSMFLALIRRFLCKLVPQTYYLKLNDGRTIATYKQRFNPFVFKLDVTSLVPEEDDMDKLVAAGAILLTAIEGRQK